MINWFWKHKRLMHRMPVLLALLAGFMLTVMPAGKSLFAATNQLQEQQVHFEKDAANGQEIPVFQPAYMALAQVAPLQLFFYQPAILPVYYPVVEIVEQAPAAVPPLVNQLHRTLFRQIISPNAP